MMIPANPGFNLVEWLSGRGFEFTPIVAWVYEPVDEDYDRMALHAIAANGTKRMVSSWSEGVGIQYPDGRVRFCTKDDEGFENYATMKLEDARELMLKRATEVNLRRMRK